ncbi:hypothetical protein [Streptomyces sp. NPDC054786]
MLRKAGTATAALGTRPSVQFTGPVDTRVDDISARELLAALGEALAAVTASASAQPQPTRVEIAVDLTVPLPGRRPVIRLTVTCPDSADRPVTWERPLHGGPGA